MDLICCHSRVKPLPPEQAAQDSLMQEEIQMMSERQRSKLLSSKIGTLDTGFRDHYFVQLLSMEIIWMPFVVL